MMHMNITKLKLKSIPNLINNVNINNICVNPRSSKFVINGK
jgi:hypothetical protein